jgi:hypothetical protein
LATDDGAPSATNGRPGAIERLELEIRTQLRGIEELKAALLAEVSRRGIDGSPLDSGERRIFRSHRERISDELLAAKKTLDLRASVTGKHIAKLRSTFVRLQRTVEEIRDERAIQGRLVAREREALCTLLMQRERQLAELQNSSEIDCRAGELDSDELETVREREYLELEAEIEKLWEALAAELHAHGETRSRLQTFESDDTVGNPRDATAPGPSEDLDCEPLGEVDDVRTIDNMREELAPQTGPRAPLALSVQVPDAGGSVAIP